jgi:phage baseplate assembly protein W
MAFGAKRIFPIDTKPGTGIGAAIPFNAPAVFKITYTTKDAIRTNLINFFLTEPNERYLNPTFGGGLRSFIFEQINNNPIEGLKENIQFKLNTNFPNVIVNTLDVLQDPDYNTLIISINYSMQDMGITDDLEISFN